MPARAEAPALSDPAACVRVVRWVPMRFVLLFVLLLLLIGGGLKLAGMQIPILDYPLGGPLTQPQIEIQQPDLNLP